MLHYVTTGIFNYQFAKEMENRWHVHDNESWKCQKGFKPKCQSKKTLVALVLLNCILYKWFFLYVSVLQ